MIEEPKDVASASELPKRPNRPLEAQLRLLLLLLTWMMTFRFEPLLAKRAAKGLSAKSARGGISVRNLRCSPYNR